MSSLKPMELYPLSEDHIQILAEKIDLRECVLVLGPLVTASVKNGHNLPVRQKVVEELNSVLEKNAPKDLLPADPTDLAMTCTAYQKYKKSRSFLDHYVGELLREHTEPSALLREIVHLPFRIIFTVAQDDLLERAFAKEGRLCQQGTYRMGEIQTDKFDEASKNTIIYHLFGRVLDKGVESLVLTEEDQMNYIDSVVGGETQFPSYVRNVMQSCPIFLFIGFDYNYWYLRVLLHIIKFKTKADLVFGLHYNNLGPMTATTAAFFTNQFNFAFACNSDLELVQNLRSRLNHYEESTKPDHLRKLLYLFAPQDRDFVFELDKALTNVKSATNTNALFIDQTEFGVVKEAQKAMLESAGLVVPVLSADFCSDDNLVIHLLPMALERQTANHCRVVAVYAREVNGATELLRGKAPMLPGENIAVSEMNPDKAFEKIAGELKKVLVAL